MCSANLRNVVPATLRSLAPLPGKGGAVPDISWLKNKNRLRDIDAGISDIGARSPESGKDRTYLVNFPGDRISLDCKSVLFVNRLGLSVRFQVGYGSWRRRRSEDSPLRIQKLQ